MQEAGPTKTLIYFAPVGEGGLAKYAVFQIAALVDAGVNVIVLGSTHLKDDLSVQAPTVEFIGLAEQSVTGNKIVRALKWIRNLRSQANQLSNLIQDRDSRHVLITCFAEYFVPFWIGPLQSLKKQGVRFGTIVHDPVRDFQVGPNWWHQLCISAAYSLINVAYVHSDVTLDTGWPRRNVSTCQIPHGPYDVPVAKSEDTRKSLRARLGIPQHTKLLLSFGHIRDGKNLDLLIIALGKVPNLHLLVVGREQSSSQHSVKFYQDHAQQQNVQDRCHWVNEFVPDDEVSRYFRASDYIALVYSADFRSASGVLSLASQFELQVLGSSGKGPLRDSILEYHLGVFVEPDNTNALVEGLNQLGRKAPAPVWHAYKRDHSWQANAKTVAQTLFDECTAFKASAAKDGSNAIQ